MGIRIETFEKAVHLDHQDPTTTEQAQYSIPFPVAAALVKGSRGETGWYGLGPGEMIGPALADPETRRLAHALSLVEAPELTAVFPRRFLARVRLTLADGRTLTSPDTTFRGELDDPLTDAEVSAKYRWLAGTLLCETRAAELEAAAWGIADAPSIEPLLALLVPPPDMLPGLPR